MLPKTKRLTTHVLKDVLLKGKLYHGEHFLLRYKAVPLTEVSKYAVIVPKKLAPTAVARNLYRRRVYSILQKDESSLPEHCYIAIMMKKGAEKLNFDAIEQELTTLFKNLFPKSATGLKKA